MILFSNFTLSIFVCLISALVTQLTWAQGNHRRDKPRLIILTDVSAFLHSEGEPDDSQSLVRLMLYTNELELEGLIATSNLRHGQRTRPELLRKVVDTYGQVQPNLLLHDKNYPSANVLSALIKTGTPVAGPLVPVGESVGEGKDTEGSDWIIKAVDKKDRRPLWVAIWGGSADLAQALWKVRATRTPDQVKLFIAKLRVHAVYDQDATGPWIREQFPGLFVIFRHHGIRGMYRGGDTTLVRSSWVETNIRNNHGPLGALYTHYRGGDVWGRTLGRVNGIKEGDTPSFLYLLSNGLNDPEHPEWGNWSGRFKKDSAAKNLWVEAIDSIANFKTDMDPRMAALYRWRPAWQSDFEARLDWCVKSFQDANHAPRLDTNVKESIAHAGKQAKLTSPAASDPDNNEVHFDWYFYPEAGTYTGELPPLKATGRVASFTAPTVPSPQTIHIVLEVTDNGKPALTTYKRFIVLVKP